MEQTPGGTVLCSLECQAMKREHLLRVRRLRKPSRFPDSMVSVYGAEPAGNGGVRVQQAWPEQALTTPK